MKTSQWFVFGIILFLTGMYYSMFFYSGTAEMCQTYSDDALNDSCWNLIAYKSMVGGILTSIGIAFLFCGSIELSSHQKKKFKL